MVLGALVLTASRVSSVAIGQDRANTLHSYVLKEWATPAKLNTCSGTGVICQSPASQSVNSSSCYLCLRRNFNYKFLLPLSHSCAIQQHIPFMQWDSIPHLTQCNCRLLQKLFPAPHFSWGAAGCSSHRASFGSLRFGVQVLFGSGHKYSVKLVPVREKGMFCLI